MLSLVRCSLVAALLAAGRLEAADKILVFAGQSNMGGKGTANTTLPPELAGEVPNVVGFYCNAWDTVGGAPEPFGVDVYPDGRFRFNWATARRDDCQFHSRMACLMLLTT